MKALLLALLTLAGCASQVASSMNSFVGKPARQAFAAYGHPQDERTVAGQKIYIWTVGSGSSMCTMRFMVDKNDIIQEGDAEGNTGRCAQFAR